MKRIQRYILGLVAVLALAGCSSHHHHGMAGEGTGDAYWQKGQQDMASLIDRTVKDHGKAEQVKLVVNDIVAELKAGREQARAGGPAGAQQADERGGRAARGCAGGGVAWLVARSS